MRHTAFPFDLFPYAMRSNLAVDNPLQDIVHPHARCLENRTVAARILKFIGRKMSAGCAVSGNDMLNETIVTLMATGNYVVVSTTNEIQRLRCFPVCQQEVNGVAGLNLLCCAYFSL
jgi:hypothetical protein